MYIQIYKCRQITIKDHNSGISGENANEPSNSFKPLGRANILQKFCHQKLYYCEHC